MKFPTALSSSLIVCAVTVLALTQRVQGANRLELWYAQPASNWNEALPIGNGRMGAMIFGGVTEERLQFNEGTLWTGQPHEYHHEGAVKSLPVLRDLCNQSRALWIEAVELDRQGKRAEADAKRKESRAKQKEAEDIGRKEFMSIPLGQMAYQPFGDVRLSFPAHTNATDYRRHLDLDTATAGVRYRIGDTTFTRECFATFPDKVMVWRVASDQAGPGEFHRQAGQRPQVGKDRQAPRRSTRAVRRGAGRRVEVRGADEDHRPGRTGHGERRRHHGRERRLGHARAGGGDELQGFHRHQRRPGAARRRRR